MKIGEAGRCGAVLGNSSQQGATPARDEGGARPGAETQHTLQVQRKQEHLRTFGGPPPHMVDASEASHIPSMITFTPNPHSLRVAPSQTEPGRFDWAILKDGAVVRRSIRSFGSEGTSAADGDTALREVTALWRDAK